MAMAMAMATDTAMVEAGKAWRRLAPSFSRSDRCVQGGLLLSFLWSATASAQMASVPGASSGSALPAIAAPGEGGASTDPTPRRAWYVQPKLNVTETITDNAVVSAGPRQSNQITQLSPGVRVASSEFSKY